MSWYNGLPMLIMAVAVILLVMVMERAVGPLLARHYWTWRGTPPADEGGKRAYQALRQRYLARWYEEEPRLEAAIGRILSRPQCLTALAQEWEQHGRNEADQETWWDDHLSGMRDLLPENPICLENLEIPANMPLPRITLNHRIRWLLLCLMLLQASAIPAAWLWPNQPSWSRYMMLGMLLFGMAVTKFHHTIVVNSLAWSNQLSFALLWGGPLLLFHATWWPFSLSGWIQIPLAILAVLGWIVTASAYL